MSGNFSRLKGAEAERAACRLLEGWLGVPFTRNLRQSAHGGPDIVGPEWLAVEVKRAETLRLSEWFRTAQANACDWQIPLLMYRKSYAPWIFMAPVDLANGQRLTVTLYAPEARRWLRLEHAQRQTSGDRRLLSRPERSLAAARAYLGLSRRELAQDAGVHVSTLSRLENNRVTPSTPTLRRIARALSLPMERLCRE